MTANSSTIRTSKNSKIVIDDVLLLRMRNATLNANNDEFVWGDSDSGLHSNSIGTRQRTTGTISGLFDEDQTIYSIVREGQISKLVLWEDGTNYWAFPCALLSNLQLTYDQDSKNPIEWSFDYGTDGIYYAPGEAGAPTESLPT